MTEGRDKEPGEAGPQQPQTSVHAQSVPPTEPPQDPEEASDRTLEEEDKRGRHQEADS